MPVNNFHLHCRSLAIGFLCCAASMLSLSGCAVSYQVKTQNEAKDLIDNTTGTVYRSDSVAIAANVPESRGSYRAGAGQHVRKTIRLGLQVDNYTEGYTKALGYSFGASTAIKLFSIYDSYFALGLDGNYTSITDFVLNVPQSEYRYAPGKPYRVYYSTLYDERYHFSFFDLGIFPQYVFPILGDLSASLYVGQSFGIGIEIMTPYLTSQTLIDSTPHLTYSPDQAPYIEYANGARVASIFNLGASIYYKALMVDVRFRDAYMGDRRKMYKHIFLQFGFSL